MTKEYIIKLLEGNDGCTFLIISSPKNQLTMYPP